MTPDSHEREGRAGRRADDRAVASIGAVVLALALLILVGGYGAHWRWIGVSGATATLWDWLHLAALPVAVALIPVLVELRPQWARRHVALLVTGGAVFVGLVLAGYLAHWRWTGFTGNTVWDWLHLLLLPLLVPAVIIPMLRPVVSRRFSGQEQEQEPQADLSGPLRRPSQHARPGQ